MVNFSHDSSMPASLTINLIAEDPFRGDCLTSQYCCVHVCCSASAAFVLLFLSSHRIVTLHTCSLIITCGSILETPPALLLGESCTYL